MGGGREREQTREGERIERYVYVWYVVHVELRMSDRVDISTSLESAACGFIV